MNMICGLLKANLYPQEDAEEWKEDHAKIVLKRGRT